MGRSPIVTTIKLDGPFFQHDPAKTFRQNIKTMMAAVAREAEADVKAQMRSGQLARRPISRLGGRVSEHVIGRTKSLSGKPWAVTAVVSVNNSGFSKAEGVSLMAAASVVEGNTGAFKRTARRIRSSRKVNAAELLKGIA